MQQYHLLSIFNETWEDIPTVFFAKKKKKALGIQSGHTAYRLLLSLIFFQFYQYICVNFAPRITRYLRINRKIENIPFDLPPKNLGYCIREKDTPPPSGPPFCAYHAAIRPHQMLSFYFVPMSLSISWHLFPHVPSKPLERRGGDKKKHMYGIYSPLNLYPKAITISLCAVNLNANDGGSVFCWLLSIYGHICWKLMNKTIHKNSNLSVSILLDAY